MALKLNISEKGKSWKLELEGENLFGKSVGNVIGGKEIKSDFDGYELEITGGSDIAGFPMSKNVEGTGLGRILLSRGWGMREKIKGLRRRKTVRGKMISSSTVQLNLKVIKEGKKQLSEIFPEQNQPKEKKSETPTLVS
ncbi:MAG: S6e family ribosomal protein [Nanoarchaeota archaeon]|mgnify:CR=1 FL=1